MAKKETQDNPITVEANDSVDGEAVASAEADQGGAKLYWINDRQMCIELGAGDEPEIVEYADIPQKYGDNEEIMQQYYQLIDVTGDHFSDDNADPEQEYNSELSIEEATLAINQKIDEVAKELDIHETDNVAERLRMCSDVQKYIAYNNKYTDSLMEKKAANSNDTTSTYDLYYALVENESVCTSNSIEMCVILSEAGIDSKCVALTNKQTGGEHMAVLVDIDGSGEYYYFDPTLEREIFHQQCGENASQDEMLLCCAGLGRNTYEEYYAPVGIVAYNPETYKIEGAEPLPDNISNEGIPWGVINRDH